MLQNIVFIITVLLLSACTNKVPAPIRYEEDNGLQKRSATSQDQDKIVERDNRIMENPLGLEEPALSNANDSENSLNQSESKNNEANSAAPTEDDDLSKQLKMLDANEEGPKVANELADEATNEFTKTRPLPVKGSIINNFGDIVDGQKLTGINISAPLGSNVTSVNDGQVVFAGYHKVYGNLLIIEDKSSNIFAAYAHLKDITLQKSEQVVFGQVIGQVGTSGNTSKPMLYFAIKKQQVPLDPLLYLNQ